jgi:glycosyltransferase involved in cell wall biosynthesis
VRICVLGTHSFEGEGPKAGIQHIAESLARQGHDILYATAHASWLALFFPAHRGKYLSTFRPLRVNDRLLQVTPVNFVPMRVLKRLEGTPLGWGLERINAAVERTRGRLLEDAEFDLCIFSATSSITLVPKVRARRFIYRVNDLLRGFESAPRTLLDFESRILLQCPIAEVCAVNEELAESVCRSHPHLRVRVIPNGVDLSLFGSAVPDISLSKTRATNVIYVGAFHPWTDVDLVFATAELLPDHTFHLYGNWNRPAPERPPGNVRLHGPIRHQDIASKMKSCSVGLIPSGRQNSGRMVEKPLKFYEYLAAGLGVAATSHGGKGLEPFAVIGDTPAAFAAAIHRAKAVPGRLGREIEEALRNLEWDHLVERLLDGHDGDLYSCPSDSASAQRV